MTNFTSAFADSLGDGHCGLTIDHSRGGVDSDVVQFLWATPSSKFSPSELENLTQQVNSAAQAAGFTPAKTEPYMTSLPNEVAILQECPFQPQHCNGPHLVISGSGLTNRSR